MNPFQLLKYFLDYLLWLLRIKPQFHLDLGQQIFNELFTQKKKGREKRDRSLHNERDWYLKRTSPDYVNLQLTNCSFEWTFNQASNNPHPFSRSSVYLSQIEHYV